jgi:HrpA-like RNA helicase
MPKPTLLVAGSLAGAAGREHPDEVPIEYITAWLRRRMPTHGGGAPQSLADRVLVVRSETGSGKSTVLPAYLLRLLRSEKTAGRARLAGGGVICTQPRILTAQTLARDQAADENYPDLVLGETVGYQTGPVSEMPQGGLVYATAGVLLAQMRMQPDADLMARYRFVVVDEAHERSLDTDTLLMRLKGFLTRNLGEPRLPFVLLASATLPVEKYARYFGLGPENVIEVTGRAYPVERFFPEAGANDYVAEAARVALRIHEEHPDDPPERADVLVFVPGARETEGVVERLTKANWAYRAPGAEHRPFLLLAISREEIIAQGRDYRLLKVPPAALRLPAADGKRLLRPARRIVVSTVVAETGLTIETLKYVVDCGWSRVQETYFPGGYRGLVTRPAPQSRVKQRMGRAGRKFPGEFFPLYTQNVYEALPKEQPPEVVTEGVGPIFLDVVAATAAAAGGVFRVGDVDMLDPPPVDSLAAALEQAAAFGFLRAAPEAGGQALTRLGEAAGRFHYLRMPQAQTLMAGYLWRAALRDLALVAALYELEPADLLYYVPPPGQQNKQAEAEKARRLAVRAGLPRYLLGPEEAPEADPGPAYRRARLLLADDFLEALLAFEGFAAAAERAGGDLGALLDWCEANGVDFRKAVALADAREAVVNEMLGAGLNPFWGEEHRLAAAAPADFLETAGRLKNCIYAGLRFALLEYDARAGAYRSRAGDLVGAPPGFSDAALAELGAGGKPRRLVASGLRLRPAKKQKADRVAPLLFTLEAAHVSALDGFVAVDPAALEPRVAPSI